MADSEEHIAEADVYKDTAKSGVVVMRRTRLFKDTFVTFHNFSKDPTDKRTWLLDRKCLLHPASEDGISEEPEVKSVRPDKTSTLMFAVKQKLSDEDIGQNVPLYCFTLEWPATWAPAGYSSFVFGFLSRKDACAWHQLLQQRIATQAVTKRKGHSRTVSSDVLPTVVGALPSPDMSTTTPRHSTAGTTPTTPDVVSAFERPAVGVPVAPLADTHGDEDSDQETRHKRRRQAKRERLQKSIFHKRWVPVRQTNGVSVYYHANPEGADATGGEYMVSAIVRGSPKDCLDVLVLPGSNTSILGPAHTVEVLATEEHVVGKDVLRILLASPCVSYLAPRELVVERMVRTDEEGYGLHAILFSSCTPPPTAKLDCQSPRLGWWKRPVFATVRGGYTIAPLDDFKLDASPESLVTLVVKVDLGGVCSSRSWLHPFADTLGWTELMLDRILMSVNLLRDEVEQARFAVQPFAMFQNDDEPEEDLGTLNSLTLSKESMASLGSPMAATTGGRGLMRTASSVVRQSISRREGARRTTTPSDLSPEPPAKAPSETKTTVLADGVSGALSALAEEEAAANKELEVGILDLDKIKSLATLDTKYWDTLHTQGHATPYSVRGPTYLKDKKKIVAGEPEFFLSAVDFVAVDAPVEHIARFLPSVRQGGAPFSIVIHLVIPGHPVIGLVQVLSHPTHPKHMGEPPKHPMEEEHDWSPFDFVLHKFVTGSDAVRNRMLKMIPHIADGSWMIKSSVGTVPVIIGKALKTKYTLTETYLEVDIDITANTVANYVTGLVRGATQSLVIDFGFVLEGTTPWELPELLLGAMRLNRLDVKAARPLDMSKEIPLQMPAFRKQAAP